MDEIYVTTKGHEITFVPIPGLLAKAQAGVIMPKVPAYSYEDVAGTPVTEPMDEAVAADEKTSPEDKARWDEYQTAQRLAEIERFTGSLDICLKAGIRFEEREGWEAEHEWMNIDVPTDPLERRMHYIETEVLGRHAEDTLNILMGVARVSGLNKELIGTAERTFRRALGFADGDTDSGIGAEGG